MLMMCIVVDHLGPRHIVLSLWMLFPPASDFCADFFPISKISIIIFVFLLTYGLTILIAFCKEIHWLGLLLSDDDGTMSSFLLSQVARRLRNGSLLSFVCLNPTGRNTTTVKR